MDRIDGDTVFQAIGRPAPSMTWRLETRLCEDCGQSYDARIASVNGQDKPYILQCPECQQKRRDQERRTQALKELEGAREHQRDIWFEQCGLPCKFGDKTFANFEAKLQPAAFTAVKQWAETYCQKGVPQSSLVLLSPDIFGLGKTHLVAALINYILETDEPARFRSNSLTIIRQSLPAFFTTETLMLARIRATFNRGQATPAHKGRPIPRPEDYKDSYDYDYPEPLEDTEELIYQKLTSYDVLAIDDIGKVRPHNYSFLQSVYFRVIDERYCNELPVVLTTNLDYAELEAHLGGGVADRLREMCGQNFIRMTGISYRHASR